MANVDDMWEAARQLGEAIAQQRAAERQAKKDARNARRRAAYARRPKVVEPVSTAEEDWEPFCRCHVVAPCSFCESGGGVDDD
ncbi:hypothetical protein ACFFX1_55345 [Dactylosporangium sucinum]|uniref:Uncharacterized protein n=1 Tax=Dactylosporangium sucinum TaxID=1424081 RepID=A0A917U2X2_9ACTN|nr:hypothetical protein [Dactylosporangium sucinum]GGM52797.1 hypothetical protein GCM10007977_062950 [Dactylosporangium sucinum]